MTIRIYYLEVVIIFGYVTGWVTAIYLSKLITTEKKHNFVHQKSLIPHSTPVFRLNIHLEFSIFKFKILHVLQIKYLSDMFCIR